MSNRKVTTFAALSAPATCLVTPVRSSGTPCTRASESLLSLPDPVMTRAAATGAGTSVNVPAMGYPSLSNRTSMSAPGWDRDRVGVM